MSTLSEAQELVDIRRELPDDLKWEMYRELMEMILSKLLEKESASRLR